jgi:hypothetical protein
MSATKAELALIIATVLTDGLKGLEAMIQTEQAAKAEDNTEKVSDEQEPEETKQTTSRKRRPASNKQKIIKSEVADDDDDDDSNKEITEESIREQIRIIKSAYGQETAYAPFKEYRVIKLKDLTTEQLKELYETHKKMIKEIDHKAA